MLGDDRVRWLSTHFDCGVQDLCVYWFRRAADELPPGGRAGLVGTNSISQNRARGASLNYVVERGGVITDAVSKQKWPGEAVVNVSIVNWVKQPERAPGQGRLDGAEVSGISTRLRKSKRYPAALALVRDRVKPVRDRNRRKVRRERWWRWAEVAVGLRAAIAPRHRYIAGNAQGKRFLFTWQPPKVCPSNLRNVFAFDDDYAMAVLTSCVHQTWAHSESSTLRVDLRYTPTTCFETFPWPSATAADRVRIGAIAAQLVSERQAITIREGIGLTALYNAIDDGAWRPIAELHRRLDAAVLGAYGWPADLCVDPLEQKVRLAVRHADIASGRISYDPFV